MFVHNLVSQGQNWDSKQAIPEHSALHSAILLSRDQGLILREGICNFFLLVLEYCK